jgi:hypothetical protein
LGENIISVERNNENLNANNKNMKELLSSSNYNDYLNQMNSINFNEEEFNNCIIEKYKSLYDMDLEEELFKIKNGGCCSLSITHPEQQRGFLFSLLITLYIIAYFY